MVRRHQFVVHKSSYWIVVHKRTIQHESSLHRHGETQNGDGPYYIDKTENYVKYLVNEVEKHQSLKGRYICTDRLYTSIFLANWHLSRDITTIRTLNTNRDGIPKELKDVKGREEFQLHATLNKNIKIYV